MSQNMSENEPVPTPPASSPTTAPGTTTPTTPKRKKRRWWLRLLIALPILLIVLILLAPTILSLGFVRAMIAPTLRTSFTPNGRLEIGDWSFGWFSGQRLEGITLYDDQNAAVAHLNVRTGASILGVLRGRYALGDTTVDGDFDIRIDPETGRVNLLHILGSDKPLAPDTSAPEPQSPPQPESEPKPRPAPAKKEPLPINLADVQGKVTVNLHGTVSPTNGDRNAIPLTNVTAAHLVVDLNNIEQGLGIDGTLKMTVNDKPATLSIKGTADAIENNVVIDDPNKLSADLTATIEQLDLAVVKAALAAAGQNDVDVAGLLKGKIVISAKPGSAATLHSEDNLGIDNLVVTAPQLKGDTFHSKRVDVPLNISRASGSDVIKIDALGLKTDVATLAVNGSVSQASLQNLADQKAPGTPGSITVKADVPSFAALAAMLPHTMNVKDGVQITGGGLSQSLVVDLLGDGVKLTEAAIVNVDGTAAGNPIKLDKTTLNASADLAIVDGKPIDPMSSVRSLAIDLAAPFATVKGGGVPSKLQIDGNVDLTRFYDDVAQFVDLGKIDLKGSTTFSLTSNGLPTDATSPLGLAANFNAKNLVITNDQVAYLNNESVVGNLDLLLKQKADANVITFRKLMVHSESGLFDLAMKGDTAWVVLDRNGGVGGEGVVEIGASLDRLLAPFTAGGDPKTALKRGRLGGTITFATDAARNLYTIVPDVTIGRLTVGDLLSEETVRLTSNATLPTDFSSADATFNIGSSFATFKGDAKATLKDPKKQSLTPIEMVRSLNFSGDVPSLQKLYALADSVTAKPVADASTPPLPPLSVESGSLSFNGKVTRDDAKQVTSIVFDVPGVKDLSLSRGEMRFRQAEPITVSFAADVSTDTSKATLFEQLKRIVVSKLDANIPRIAKVTMPQAIEVTNLDQPTPTANGTIQADGNLQPLGEFLGVVNGSNPLPVSGTFTTQQKVGTHGDSLSLVGGMKLDALRPLGKDAQPLPENLQTVELANDLSMDTKAKAATIRKLDLSAPKAKDVLGFTAAGTIRDLGTKNTFDGVGATLSYDLPQLWPLAEPFVDPTGESIGRIEKLAGKYQKKFTIAGSYPTVDKNGKPILFNQSVRSLDVSGDLQIDSASLVDKGVDVANLAIPLTIKGGVLKIAKADGSLPPDFDVNSGKGKLAGITVDLTAAEPMIAKLDKHPLVTNATLNPIMSNALGKFFNPIFPNATKARALVSVNVSADHLLLGKSLTTKDSGKATIVLSLTEMEISNPLGEQLLGGLLNQASGALKLGGGLDTSDFANFRGELKNATFTLDKGVVAQNATFMVGSVRDPNDPKAKPEKLYPFAFTGNVSLANLGMDLNAGLPMQLVRDRIKSGDLAKVLQYMPDELPIGFGGTTTQPKLNFKDASKTFSEALFKFGASKLAGDKGDSKTGDKVDDILGGLLGGDKKKADDDKSKDDKNGKKKDDAKKDDARKDDAKKADDAKSKDKPEQPANDDKKKKKK